MPPYRRCRLWDGQLAGRQDEDQVFPTFCSFLASLGIRTAILWLVRCLCAAVLWWVCHLRVAVLWWVCYPRAAVLRWVCHLHAAVLQWVCHLRAVVLRLARLGSLLV